MKHRIKIKPISVNKCWQGRRFKTPEYERWARDFSLLLPRSLGPLQGDLELSFTWGVSNMASDADNPCKPAMDVLSQKYGFNDKQVVALHLHKVKTPKGQEFIEFEIKELTGVRV